MACASNKEYEDLLQEYGEDQLLLNALEESARFYQEVEVPHRTDEPGTSGQTSRQGETSVPERQQFIGMDEDGFDRGAGRTWIYPTNYPIRDYQFNIVQCALFKNTLVSLPTGLGKTFIAAVVMYNFYRWYPEGKVLFLAPTRPLVAQQIDSCYKVMGIPKNDTAEMTGQMPPNQREVHWKKCRVFFLTPQSLMSDLMRSTCPVQQIRCVVIDEAHRATKNYAYCQVIQAILPFNKFFRVLALSATPGNDLEAVQQVIKNLLIEHVEVRDEQSSDTAQYTNERTIETIVVRLEGFHKYIEDSYCRILGTYMDLLLRWKLIYTNARNVSKYALMMARNKFRSNPPPGISQNIARQIEGDFFLCMSLAHGLELLNQHGLRNLFRYLKGILEDEDKSNPTCRARLSNNVDFQNLLKALEERLGETDLKEPDLNTSIGAIQTQSAPSIYSHPKMEKLRDVIINHFQTYQLKGEETRVMVFCQYRDTVVEVCHLLARLKPLVKVMSFVGQSTGKSNKGLSQKQQLQIMERFRKGGYNTLISTSIGEEGLDIGEVDLIVCYDAHASPIRLVQRMGRTGRKRQGRIVMLLTEGKENKKYHQSLCNRKSMNTGLVNSKQFMKFLYKSPRMVPSDFEPECYKMFMSMPKISRDRDVRKMLMNKKSHASKENGISKNLMVDDTDLDIPADILPETKYLHAMEADMLLKSNSLDPQKFCLDLDSLLLDNEPTCVSRSTVSMDLQELLEFAARRRCDVPLTQTANLASQVNRNVLWPRRKRKNATTQLNKKEIKQKRLTSLWTNKNDALALTPVSDICEILENNPIIDTIEPSEVEEENMIDILSDSLIMTEHMFSKIKKLEEGTISCCKFSRMFQKSGLSNLTVGSEKGDSKPVSRVTSLEDSGYFDELLNPKIWMDYNSRRKGDLVMSQTFGGFDELLDPEIWENSSDDGKKDASPRVSQKRRRRVKNYLIDDHFSVNQQKIDSELNVLVSCEDELENDLSTDIKVATDSESEVVHCHEDAETKFDIGITQLMQLSPDLSQDSLDTNMDVENDGNSCSLPNVSGNESQKKFYKGDKISNIIPVKEDSFNSILSGKETRTNTNVTEIEKEDQGNLSNFVDEAILKWFGSSEDDFELPSSPNKSEKDREHISNAPLSPIISTQRKKPVLKVLSSSTPKPDKIQLGIIKDNKKDGKKNRMNKNRADLPGAGAVFIENEADESREHRRDSSDGENTSGLDELDDSFVDDEERTVNESVDIQAHYLRSVRSPVKLQGQFQFKEIKNYQGNVYSQALTVEELQDSYEQDSFCVSTNSEGSDSFEEDTLDIIEAVLKKKTKRKSTIPKKSKSRKRIRLMSSSSNEEMDELRNIPPTQFFSDSSAKKNILHGKEKIITNSSSNIENSSEKGKFVSKDDEKRGDPTTDYWDDNDCCLLDDNFVESFVNDSPFMDEQEKSDNHKIIDDMEKFSPIYESETGPTLNSPEFSGVRKQLKFLGNNPEKKALMTDFFIQKKCNKESSSNIVTSEKQVNFQKPNNLKGVGKDIRGIASCSAITSVKEDKSNIQGQLIVIAASRQVVSAPEVITSLKARHNMIVHIHSDQTAHYVVSPYVGVVRVTLKDISGHKTVPVFDMATNLTAVFQQAYFIVEITPGESNQKGTWPVDLSTRLRKMGLRMLHSDGKSSTADLLANLCCREFSCGHSVQLPKFIKNGTTAMVSFFEGLPGVNIAMAFDLCCRFKTIADFISKCKSVPDIRRMLGLNRERARKIYFLLHDAL